MLSRNESTRRVRHTTSSQCYIKHKRKNFKFSGYLVLILMLWGGLISAVSANNSWMMFHAGSSTFPAPNYIFPAPKPYFQTDGTRATADAIRVAFSIDNCEASVLAVDPAATNIQVNAKALVCDWDYRGNPNTPVAMGWTVWGITCNDGWHGELDAAGTRLVCVGGPPPSESCPEGWSYHYYKKRCIEPPSNPPEKKLGGCSTGPSPFVADKQ